MENIFFSKSLILEVLTLQLSCISKIWSFNYQSQAQ